MTCQSPLEQEKVSFNKFGLNSWRNDDITIKLPITDIFGCHDTGEVRNDIMFTQWLCHSSCQKHLTDRASLQINQFNMYVASFFASV